jgi:membrane associated rhomboid family serine protease
MQDEFQVITFVLVVLNISVFLLLPHTQQFLSDYGLTVPSLVSRPYTLITHMFIHSDIVHLIGNMAILSIIGVSIENKIGSGRFLFIYLFSGLCTVPFAFLIGILSGVEANLVGASGAIFGLVFVAGIVSGFEKVPFIGIPVLLAIFMFLMFNLVLFIINFPMSISEFAHFGGFLGGIVGAFLIAGRKE